MSYPMSCAVCSPDKQLRYVSLGCMSIIENKYSFFGFYLNYTDGSHEHVKTNVQDIVKKHGEFFKGSALRTIRDAHPHLFTKEIMERREQRRSHNKKCMKELIDNKRIRKVEVGVKLLSSHFVTIFTTDGKKIFLNGLKDEDKILDRYLPYLDDRALESLKGVK